MKTFLIEAIKRILSALLGLLIGSMVAAAVVVGDRQGKLILVRRVYAVHCGKACGPYPFAG
jgi:hypothetical protein